MVMNAEPTICSNDYDYKHSNGTPYHLFICPTENLTQDYNYCCGVETRQRCCRYSDRYKQQVLLRFPFFVVSQFSSDVQGKK